MDALIESLQLVWVEIQVLLARIITPDWNDVLRWVPALLLGLAGLVVAVLLVAWLRNRRVTASRMIPVVRGGGPPPAGVHMPGPSKWVAVIPLGLAFFFAGLVFHPARVGGDPTQPAALPDLVNLPFMLLGIVIAAIGAAGWYRDAGREWQHVEGTAWHEEEPTSAWADAPAHEPLPEGMHLPGPSPWPILAPFGLAVAFFGLVVNPVFILAGLVMATIAAGGWYIDAGREYRAVEAGHPLDGSQVDPASRLPGWLLATYATIAVAALVVAAIPAYVSWVNPQPTEEPAASLSPNQVVVAESVLGFAETTMRVPAGVELTIDFQNPDAGVQHNWSLYEPGSETALYPGEIITGPSATTYTVPALAAGTYDYVCDVHPQTMTGTLTAQ